MHDVDNRTATFPTLVDGTVAYDMRGGHVSWNVNLTCIPAPDVTWHAKPFVVAWDASR